MFIVQYASYHVSGEFIFQQDRTTEAMLVFWH